MILEQDFIDKVKEFEGFTCTSYYCPAGVLTIGYGRTENVKPNECTTKEKETEWLSSYLEDLYNKVCYLEKRYLYSWSHSQKLALTDFMFNLGVGNVKQLLKNGKRTDVQIAATIPLYNHANGKVLEGLTRRRKWEYELFTKDSKPSPIIQAGVILLYKFNNVHGNFIFTNSVEHRQLGDYLVFREYTNNCLHLVKETDILENVKAIIPYKEV